MPETGKMVDHQPIAAYLVPCSGTRHDGARCEAFVLLGLDEKTICPECGTVAPSWRAYLSHHARTKANA
jgi:hypothetical protein